MPLGNIQVRTSAEVDSYAKRAGKTEVVPATTEFRPSALGVAEGLYKLIERRRQEYPQQRVYASQIKSCARQQAMGIMGFTKGKTGEGHPEWVVAAELGTWLHDRVEAWLKALGGLVRSEFRVSSEDGAISGRVDALMTSPAETATDYGAHIEVAGEQYILDAKTVSEKDFKKGENSLKIPGYVAQISVYGRLLGVTKGIILLVNRNTGEMRDLEFDIDFDYADKLLERAARIVTMAEARQLPEAEEWGEGGSYYCRNLCPFYRQCKDEQAHGGVQLALDNGAAPEEL